MLNTKVHYVGCAGLHGYMPNATFSGESANDVAAQIGDTYDLGRVKRKILARDWSVELSMRTHGVEYAEIMECECSDISQHTDD